MNLTENGRSNKKQQILVLIYLSLLKNSSKEIAKNLHSSDSVLIVMFEFPASIRPKWIPVFRNAANCEMPFISRNAFTFLATMCINTSLCRWLFIIDS